MRLSPQWLWSSAIRVVDVAAQQMVRRLVIKFDVVERVGQDLDRPNQSGLQIPNEEQLNGSQNYPSNPDKQPAHSDLMDKPEALSHGLIIPKKVGLKYSGSGDNAQIESNTTLRRRL